MDRRHPGLRWPRKGVRYTIRENIDSQANNTWLTFVTVGEIRNRTIRWPGGRFHEAGFHEDRFEPATDISDLEKVSKTVGLFMGSDGPEEKKRRKTPQRKKEDA